MDTYEFVAALAASLAWPFVVLVAVLALRKALVDLLVRLRKAKYKDGEREVDIDFGEEVQELSEEASRANLPPPTSLAPQVAATPGQPLIAQALALVNVAPNAAVLVGWSATERELRAAGRRAVIPTQDTTVRITRLLQEAGHLTSEDSDVFRGLRHLRNSIAHGEAMPSPESAGEYVRVAERFIKKLDGIGAR